MAGAIQLGQTIRAKLGRVYYGYWILLAGSLILIFFNGFIFYGFTIFFLPLARDFNVSRTQVSMLYGLSRLEGGMEGPLVGRLIDKLGPRLVVMIGTILTGVGFILLSRAPNFMMALLVFVLVIAVGYNAGFYHPISTAINSWFIRRRGTGFAVLDSVGAAGAVFLVPALSYWVLTYGWRTGALLVGIITMAFVLPLALPIHRSPESRGLHPDGVAPSAQNQVADVHLGIRQALGTSSFWMLTLTVTLRLSITTALSAHMVPMLVWRGIDEAKAAYGVSLFALGSIVAPLVFGWLGDRWSKSRLSAIGATVGAGGLLLLLTNTSSWLLYIFPFSVSIALGTAALNWSLVGDYFGRSSYATLRGMMRVVNGVGTFVFPVYAGWAY
ncbi:MAG: MFS transporter, partial [Chloroflexi bacterium]|nr:MFS transporter [Chloroflexota bacterium]